MLCGVLNIDKPAGMTSREIVDRVLRIVRPAKAGHAGTLDPLATGVLVVCVGHATRLINIVQEGRKRYRGKFVLGQRSDTDDVTGQLTPGGDWSGVTSDRMAELLPQFVGQIQQVPPQFSAVHVQGRRAYKLARRGETMELDARPVDVYQINLTQFNPPEFELEIECGSGTYIRSIGRDLGSMLGCGAVMSELRRLSVGQFEIEQSVSLEALSFGTIHEHLQPASRIVTNFPHRSLTSDEAIAVRRGQSLALPIEAGQLQSDRDDGIDSSLHENRTALLNPTGELIGIGITDRVTGRLQPKIIFPALSADD